MLSAKFNFEARIAHPGYADEFVIRIIANETDAFPFHFVNLKPFHVVKFLFVVVINNRKDFSAVEFFDGENIRVEVIAQIEIVQLVFPVFVYGQDFVFA